MIYYIALFASISLNAVSLILLKAYALSSSANQAKTCFFRKVTDLRLLASMALYGFAAVFWIVALLRIDLIIAYPSLALTYVCIGLLAPRLFAEELSRKRWIGIVLIVSGVIIINL